MLFEEFVHDAFEAEALDGFNVIFHGLGALLAIALDDGAARHAMIQDHPIENLLLGVFEDRADVIGGGEMRSFAGLGHEIADVDAFGAGSGDGFGDSGDEQIRNYAGKERAGAENDEIGVRDRLDIFLRRFGMMAREPHAADRATRFCDVALRGNDAAIVHEGFERNIFGRGRQDATVNTEELASLFDRAREITGDLRERGEKQIAHAVSAEAAAGVKAELEGARDGGFVIRESSDAIADIARGKNAVIAAQAAGTAAVVCDGDNRCEIGYSKISRLTGNGGEIAEATKKSGKAGAAT